MQTPNIQFILVGSRRRVGKDTFANLLEQKFKSAGVAVFKQGFAEALRRECDEKINSVVVGVGPSGNDEVGLLGRDEKIVDFWSEEDGYKEKFVRPILLAYGQAITMKRPEHWAAKLDADAGHVAHNVGFQRGDLFTERHVCDVPDASRTDPRLIVLCSDWRKPVELEYLRNAGRDVLSINVERQSAPPPAGFEVELSHLCRAQADIQIDNDSDLGYLERQAEAIVWRVLKKPKTTAVS